MCLCLCAPDVCSANIDKCASSFSSSFFIYTYSLSVSFSFSFLCFSLSHSLVHSHALYYSSSNFNTQQPSHMHITYIHFHACTIHLISSKNEYTANVCARHTFVGRILAYKNSQKRKKILAAKPHTHTHTHTQTGFALH